MHPRQEFQKWTILTGPDSAEMNLPLFREMRCHDSKTHTHGVRLMTQVRDRSQLPMIQHQPYGAAVYSPVDTSSR